MKALSHQQIKQKELQLLQTSGFSLAECSEHLNSNKVFKELTHSVKIAEIQRLKVSRVRNLGLSSNANLRSFTLALLTSIYSVHLKEDLLDLVKSFLYHPELDLSIIKHAPVYGVSSNQMKKLVVQFFYSLAYSSYDDKIEGKCCKYPIVMDILVLFLRSILIHLKVKNADDYLLKLNTKEIFRTLIDFFDLNCKQTNSMVLFYEDKLFLYQNQHGEALVGHYSQNYNQNKIINNQGNNFKLSELSQQIIEDVGNEKIQRPSLANHNRSLQLKGIVGESIMFEPEAPTPFFNSQQQDSSSFQSSHQNSIHLDQPQTKQRQSIREGNLLKFLDISMHQSQTYLAFGNQKRTSLENHLKDSLQSKKEQKIDSPITLDSPQTLFSQGNFGRPYEKKAQEQVKIMKKSKSESARPLSSTLSANNQEQSPITSNMKKKQKIQIGKPTKLSINSCQCTQIKKKSIKLQSNLYQINMRFVQSSNQSIKPKQNTFQDNPQGNYYINSKGLNCQLYAPLPQTTSLQYIPQNYIKRRPKINLNTSINSCHVLPRTHKQSQTFSKRELSPLSNYGQRSFSPYGGTSSITSPKITFTYKNPLKYSIQFPKTKNQNKK